MYNEIDPELADLVAPVPQNPESSGFVALDAAFESADFGLAEDQASTFTKRENTVRRDGQGRRWLGDRWSAPGQ